MDYLISRTYLDGLRPSALQQQTLPVGFTTYKNGTKTFVTPTTLDKLKVIPSGVLGIPEITADKINEKLNNETDAEAREQMANALLSAPDEKYSVSLNASEQSVVDAIDQSVNLELVKQFYEAYYSPTGLNDAQNRLGEVDMTLNNMHELRPEGADAIMGTDAEASWRTNINYMFSVNTGLSGAKNYVFTSYAFAPMAPRTPSATAQEKLYAEEQGSSNTSSYVIHREDADGNAVPGTFNMDNLTYYGNEGTLRKPAFKSINDNINLVQFLLNRSFGVESTYINEWDLSMYMQEGIVDSQAQEDINHPGTTVYAPVFCTTLTFGILSDSPIEQNLSGDPGKSLDSDSLDEAVTFGSWNMAVSNRKGIDSITTSKGCNEYNYNISKYPLSKYWAPPMSGENLNYYTSQVKKTATNPDGSTYEYDDTVYSNMNVSHYWDDLFAIRQVGEIYGETSNYSAEAEAGYEKYTPAHILGSNLYTAKWPFEFALKHADDRAAVLSGWNSTDEEGDKLTEDTTNLCNNSNSMAYLPFYKQFFYNSGEGMEDLDQYWQSLNADGQEQHSILTCADEILDIIATDNTAFNSFKKQAESTFKATNPSTSIPSKNSAFKLNPDGSSDDEVGNISFSIPVVGRITVPHTKLLNMFLKKGQKANEAMNKSKNQGSSSFLSSGMIGDRLDNAKETKQAVKTTDPEYKYNEETGEMDLVSEGSVEANDQEEAIGSKLTYADGVNNNSPFLYGGPHGRYFSPLTLEGYCQPNNEMMKNVPTIDTTFIYHGKSMEGDSLSNTGWKDSKNYKKGSFLSTRICMSLVERSNLLGLRRKVEIPKMTVTYSSGYTVHYVYTSRAAWDFRLCFGWWHKWCISFSTPKQISALNMDNWYQSWPWSWTWWDTGSYWQPQRTTEQVSIEAILRDFTCERGSNGVKLDPADETNGFYITPIHKDWNPNKSQGDGGSNREYIRRQANDLNSYAMYNGINYANQYADDNIRFLITPRAAYNCQNWNGVVYNPGDFSSGNWHNCMYNVYVNTNYGRDTIPVTLPIRKPWNSEVLCTVIGDANIIRTQTSRVDYHWVPRVHWWPWLSGHRKRHRRWWWTHCWRWCWHWRIFWYTCWHYEAYLNTNFTAYNLILNPKKLSWVIPSKNFINSRFPTYDSNNIAKRDKTSTDIVDRWKVTSEVDLQELYPFSNDFLNRFGTRLWGLYGKNAYWDSFNRNWNCSLVADTLVLGDVMQNYVNHNNSVQISLSTDYRFLYTDKYYSWLSQYKIGKWGWYIVDQITKHQYESATLHMQSDYMIAQHTETKTYSPQLTRVINEIPQCPSVIYNEDGAISTRDTNGAMRVNNNNIKLYLFNNYDLFDSFIDTCTSQIAYLQQMSDYASRYLSDDMIYSTYLAVTDPAIINIINKAVEGAADQYGIYYTGNFTEDINYFTALEILDLKFKSAYTGENDYTALGTLSLNSRKTNSIYTLCQQRIVDIQAIRRKAQSIRSQGLTWDSLEQLSLLVSDTYGLINCCNGIRSYMFPNGSTEVYTSTKTGDSYMAPSRPEYLSYNLVDNPATLVWAYLNVLYQARKFYVNKRLDKVQGSYWILRALERVLTFQAAKTSATNPVQLPTNVEDPESSKNKNKEITFVESRTSTVDSAAKDPRDLDPEYTKAVYCKVKYIADSHFMESTKFNKTNNTYNDQGYTYVEQVYKYAYKPDNGYYYIMSKTIKDAISELYESYNTKKTDLKAGNYKISVAEVELVNERLSKAEIDAAVLLADNVNDYLTSDSTEDNPVLDKQKMAPLYQKYKSGKTYKKLSDCIEYSDELDDNGVPTGYIDMSTLVDELKFLSTRLLKYYQTLYSSLIKNQLYKVYIDWDVSSRGVGSGLDKGTVTASGDTAHHFIDQHQYKVTNGVWRKITDSDGMTHRTKDGIKSGITFNVADGANVGVLLTNFDKIGNFSAKELACSISNTADYWRIEVPEEYNIPVTSLKNSPVLVADYAVELLLSNIRGTAVTPSSVLTGASRNLASPIKHHDATLLTSATAVGLGEGVSVGSLGLEGITPSDTETTFG